MNEEKKVWNWGTLADGKNVGPHECMCGHSTFMHPRGVCTGTYVLPVEGTTVWESHSCECTKFTANI